MHEIKLRFQGGIEILEPHIENNLQFVEFSLFLGRERLPNTFADETEPALILPTPSVVRPRHCPIQNRGGKFLHGDVPLPGF